MKRILLFSFVLISLWSCQREQRFYYNSGEVFGTIYNIKYKADKDYHQEIQAVLKEVDYSLSNYIPTSIISKINHNEATDLDQHFINVFNKAQNISAQTKGAYDMTAGALVNAWGFGSEKHLFPQKSTIDSLLRITGYQKVHLEGNTIKKESPEITLDAASIAKGYGVDIVADYFETKGIENYLVEIGGEIRAKGKNNKRKTWQLGIDIPKDSPYRKTNSLQEIISLKEGAIATSGNYRRYYYKDGQKYAHIINPKTGYPSQHHVLSATVSADNCMTADAYATAFMVMGLDSTRLFLKSHPELQAYIIYAKDSLHNNVWMTPEFKKMIVRKTRGEKKASK